MLAVTVTVPANISTGVEVTDDFISLLRENNAAFLSDGNNQRVGFNIRFEIQ